MSLEYDIFISYRTESESGGSNTTTWAHQFCHNLQIVLQRLFNEKPALLLHDDLRSRQQLMKEDFTDMLKKTGVFITIINPGDINSPEYVKELNKIYEIAYGSAENAGKRNRIFKVLPMPLKEEEEPESLKSELRYNFFEINRFNKKPVTFALQEGSTADDKFWSKLVDLAYDIYNSLQEIKNQPSSEVAANNENCIFLAETSFDQQENRDILKRELHHLGYKVLPMLPLSGDSEPARASIEDNLQKSVLAIHMMGAFYGDFLKNSKYSLIDFQTRVVKEYIESKEKKPKPNQIIWIPSDLKTTDQRQSLYLKRIKRDEVHEKTEIVEAPLEVFKTIIHNKLKEITVIPEVSSTAGHTLYVMYEEPEKQKIQEYIMLIQNRGFSIVDNMETKNDYYSITQHINTLKKVDAVLIYKGSSTMEWLNSKIRDLVKIPGFGKEKPFKAIGIFSPQKTTDKSLLFLRNVTVIWNDEINNASIHHFLDQIIKK